MSQSPYISDVRFEAVHINPNVYVVFRERIHAARMVCRSVHMVDSDGIGAQLFHESGIELALGRICERIVFVQLIGNTWRENRLVDGQTVGGAPELAFNKELIAIAGEELGPYR